MTTINPDLSPAERRAYRRLMRTLTARGIDPAARENLLLDYVQTAARLTAMRAEESAAEGKHRTQIGRTINALTAERRRLHSALFQGASKIAPPTAANSERVPNLPEESEAEADAAWREHFHRPPPGRTEEQIDAKEAELMKKFGHWRWQALTCASHAEEVEEERLIRKHRRWARDETDGKPAR